ncbi:MAG: hypothetical protein ACYS1A_19190 [Planctomycetota bacterium]|jgi:hypothetical protein
MPVLDTSKEALEKIRSKLPRITQQVFEAILDIGPTHNNRILEYLNQKEMATLRPGRQKRKWQINQITGRVNDLVHKHCIVEDLGPHKGTWYREDKTYHLWRAVGDQRQPKGWMPVPEGEKKRTPAGRRAHLQRAREATHARLVRMVEFRPLSRRKATSATGQRLLFAK